MGSKKERYQLNTSGEITSGSVRARQNAAGVGKYIDQVQSQAVLGTPVDARVAPSDASKIALSGDDLWTGALVKEARDNRKLGDVDTPGIGRTPASSSARKKHAKSSAAKVTAAYDAQIAARNPSR